MNDTFLEISALGRPAFLGQLYDAKTSTLLQGFSLYPTDVLTKKTRKTAIKSTTYKLEEVKNFSDRAKSLDVSAQLSVTIMGGAVTISGGGSYLDKQRDTSDSHTVAAIAKFRNRNESINLGDVSVTENLSAAMLAKTHATHVVTSITYGANIVGTLTQRSSNKEDTEKIKGNFSLEAFKGLGKAFSAEGRAELSVDEQEQMMSYNLEVRLETDIDLGKEKMPPTPVAMLELVAKSPSLVGTGVPCEIQLTPLSMLVSQIPSFRELAEADLLDIRTTYDSILKLESSRLWLRDCVATHSEILPTFAADINARTVEVVKLVQQARSKLREHLEVYRSASSASPSRGGESDKFIADITGEFTAAITSYEKDREEWRKYEDRMRAAEHHGFPVIGVSAIGGRMTHVDKGMLAAILVPNNVNWGTLINLYADLGVDIRQWRATLDVPTGANAEEDGKKAPVTQYLTIYADPLRKTTLESFDDKAGTLKNALQIAENNKCAVFVTYGRAGGHLGGFAWHVLNTEGWGVLINEVQNWRYIGDVHLGKPHGNGIMSYVDQTKYTGDFVLGRRDGLGKMLDAEGKDIPGQGGIFIKNVLDPNGVMVEVVVIDNTQTAVQYGQVALSKFASVRSHVERIGSIMGWDQKQRRRLTLGDGGGAIKVKVIGTLIDPSEDLKVEASSWPLEGSGPFKLTAHIL